jgi:hypothetical protein
MCSESPRTKEVTFYIYDRTSKTLKLVSKAEAEKLAPFKNRSKRLEMSVLISGLKTELLVWGQT